MKARTAVFLASLIAALSMAVSTPAAAGTSASGANGSTDGRSANGWSANDRGADGRSANDRGANGPGASGPGATGSAGDYYGSRSLVSSGAVEFSPTVTFQHQNFKREGYGNVDHFTQLDVNPVVGFCVSNHYEVTAGFLARHTSTNGNDDTALGATAGLTYNFARHGSVIPFASLGFGALFYDGFTMDNTAVLAPMLSGGVRVPVGSMAAVNMSLGYQHESNADGEFNASANRILASVGVSLFPWRTK